MIHPWHHHVSPLSFSLFGTIMSTLSGSLKKSLAPVKVRWTNELFDVVCARSLVGYLSCLLHIPLPYLEIAFIWLAAISTRENYPEVRECPSFCNTFTIFFFEMMDSFYLKCTHKFHRLHGFEADKQIREYRESIHVRTPMNSLILNDPSRSWYFAQQIVVIHRQWGWLTLWDHTLGQVMVRWRLKHIKFNTKQIITQMLIALEYHLECKFLFGTTGWKIFQMRFITMIFKFLLLILFIPIYIATFSLE